MIIRKFLMLFLSTASYVRANPLPLRLHPSGLERLLDLKHGAQMILPFFNLQDRLNLTLTSKFCLQQIKKSHTEENSIEYIGNELLTLENKRIGYGFMDMYESWSYDILNNDHWLQELALGGVKLNLLSKTPVFLNFAFYNKNLTMAESQVIQDSKLPILSSEQVLDSEELWPQVIGIRILMENSEDFLQKTTAVLTRFQEKEKRKIQLFLAAYDKLSEKVLCDLLDFVREKDIGPIRLLQIANSSNLSSQLLKPETQRQLKSLIYYCPPHAREFTDCMDKQRFICSLNQLECLQTDDLGFLILSTGDKTPANLKNLQHLKRLKFKTNRFYHQISRVCDVLVTLPKTTILDGILQIGEGESPSIKRIVDHFSDLSFLILDTDLARVKDAGDFLDVLESLSQHPEINLQYVNIRLDQPQINCMRNAQIKLPQNTLNLSLSLYPEHIDWVVQMLQGLNRIAFLDIFLEGHADCSIGVCHAQGLRKLANVLKNSPSLRFVKMTTHEVKKYVDDAGELVDFSPRAFIDYVRLEVCKWPFKVEIDDTTCFLPCSSWPRWPYSPGL